MSTAVSGPHPYRLLADQRRSCSYDTSASHLGHIQLHRPVVFNVDGDHDVSARQSSLIAKGMDWKQAVGTVLLRQSHRARADAAQCPCAVRSTAYPFPVFIRAPIWRARCKHSRHVLRALVACGWFGIQTWIGGTAIHSMLLVLWPSISPLRTGRSGFASMASGS